MGAHKMVLDQCATYHPQPLCSCDLPVVQPETTKNRKRWSGATQWLIDQRPGEGAKPAGCPTPRRLQSTTGPPGTRLGKRGGCTTGFSTKCQTTTPRTSQFSQRDWWRHTH